MREGNRTVLIVVLVVVVLCALMLCCAGVAGVFIWRQGPREVVEETTWPQPVCTPPACEGDEIYYCPGECPGGCGTECATPTPLP